MNGTPAVDSSGDRQPQEEPTNREEVNETVEFLVCSAVVGR